jgi:hypothetical protein
MVSAVRVGWWGPLVLVLVVPGASAAPLDADACQRIRNDVQALEKDGIRDLVSRGPQTGRGLAGAQLDKVRQLLDFDGQLRFRCAGAPIVALKEEPPQEEPAEAAAGQPLIDSATPGITLPAGGVVPPVKPKAPPSAAPKASAAGASPPVPKVKKKPVDDAFRPAAPTAPKAAQSAPGAIPGPGLTPANPPAGAAPKSQP